ncbi:MAG: hypothetical protein GY700_01915, partial [Propionibacteriaceae bacterium]|nr:hypothetical protein [Propionibacteriaceae bacterium]
EIDQQDSVDSNTNGGGTSPSPEDIDALKLAVEAAVARAEKADRKVRKARRRLDKAEHSIDNRQF